MDCVGFRGSFFYLYLKGYDSLGSILGSFIYGSYQVTQCLGFGVWGALGPNTWGFAIYSGHRFEPHPAASGRVPDCILSQTNMEPEKRSLVH